MDLLWFERVVTYVKGGHQVTAASPEYQWQRRKRKASKSGYAVSPLLLSSIAR